MVDFLFLTWVRDSRRLDGPTRVRVWIKAGYGVDVFQSWQVSPRQRLRFTPPLLVENGVDLQL
jgi:hypothetical protein